METLEHGIYYGFGHKSFSAKLIRGLFVPIIVLLVSAICLVVAGNTYSDALGQVGNIGMGIAVVLGIIQAVIAYLDHIGTKFMISENALYLRSGILNRHEISVPFRHINNLHQFQSITDRMLSVAKCTIEIMDDEAATLDRSYDGGDIVLRDVDVVLLSPLREAILSHANTQRMYMVNSSNGMGSSTEHNDIEQKSRMYDQYINADTDSEYKPYDSQ